MSTKAAINAYTNIGMESGIIAADPHKLIAMLYQGTLLALTNARKAMLSNDVPAKGKAISHAILIIDSGLNASLNKEVGGDLALNLAALYDYMSQRLLEANLNNDMEALKEVARLLIELKEAWEGMRRPATTPDQAQPAVAQAITQSSTTATRTTAQPAQPVATTQAPIAAAARPSQVAPTIPTPTRRPTKFDQLYGQK